MGVNPIKEILKFSPTVTREQEEKVRKVLYGASKKVPSEHFDKLEEIYVVTKHEEKPKYRDFAWESVPEGKGTYYPRNRMFRINAITLNIGLFDLEILERVFFHELGHHVDMTLLDFNTRRKFEEMVKEHPEVYITFQSKLGKYFLEVFAELYSFSVTSLKENTLVDSVEKVVMPEVALEFMYDNNILKRAIDF